VTVAALKALADEGRVERAVVAKAIASYDLGTENRIRGLLAREHKLCETP